MAISPQVAELIIQVLTQRKTSSYPIKEVATLGYPDVLVPIVELEKTYGLEGLEPHSDSSKILRFHGRPDELIPTGESFFKSLGATLTVLDIKAWRGDEVIVDLNKPLEPGTPSFDLLVDNGTTEHCFNAPQAMINYLELVRPGGLILHWNPMNMPNHGFYNFSPTFFFDWYTANECRIEHQSLWNWEPEKGEVGYQVHPTARFNFTSFNSSLLTLVTRGTLSFSGKYPSQTKYRKMGIDTK